MRRPLHQLPPPGYEWSDLGPFYTPEALASIALDLDMKESHLLEGLTGPSNNVDDDGNYSVQVLIGRQPCVTQRRSIELARG
jgi:hypothetical protein